MQAGCCCGKWRKGEETVCADTESSAGVRRSVSDDSPQIVQTRGSDSGDGAKDRGVDGERLSVSGSFCCRVCESENHPPVFTVAGAFASFVLCF